MNTKIVNGIGQVLLLSLIGVGIGLLLTHLIKDTEPKPVQPEAYCVREIPTYIKVDKKDLESDIMSNYFDIPNRTKREILDTIETVATEFNINPLILYALLHTESSMKPHAIHNDIIIELNDKKVKTKALGIAAIVPELWEDKLLEAKIISVRSDLLDPILAIRAAGFILNHNYNLPQHKNATSRDGSALLHYFGAPNGVYFDKINSKITSLTLKGLYR